MEPRSQKMYTSEIVSMVTIYPYSKAIHQIFFLIMWMQDVKPNIFVFLKVPLQTYKLSQGARCPTVSLKIEPRSPKVEPSEILSMVAICPHMKAIGEILREILRPQSAKCIFSHIMF